jgi:hypothetical protein
MQGPESGCPGSPEVEKLEQVPANGAVPAEAADLGELPRVSLRGSMKPVKPVPGISSPFSSARAPTKGGPGICVGVLVRAKFSGPGPKVRVFWSTKERSTNTAPGKGTTKLMVYFGSTTRGMPAWQHQRRRRVRHQG